MTEKKKELQEKYKEVYGKRPSPAWDEVKLQEMIDNFQEEDEDPKKDELNIDPSKSYTFRLKGDYAPIWYFPSKMKTWDDDKKKSRAIRVVSIEDSPYVDEQDEDAKSDSKSIIFTNGKLILQGTEKSRIKYLLASDGISGKKTILPENMHLKDKFELENKELVIKSKLDREENEEKARKLVNDSKTEELRNYLRSVYLTDVDNLSDDEIKLEAKNKVKTDAKEWLEGFNNPKHEIKANIQKLFSKGELDDTGSVIKWRKTGGVIMNYDDKSDVRADDALTKFIMAGGKEADDFKKVMATKLA